MSSSAPARARSDHDFRAAVDVLTDLGVWSRDGDRMTGTEWRRDLVEVLEPLLDLPDPFGNRSLWGQRGDEPCSDVTGRTFRDRDVENHPGDHRAVALARAALWPEE